MLHRFLAKTIVQLTFLTIEMLLFTYLIFYRVLHQSTGKHKCNDFFLKIKIFPAEKIWPHCAGDRSKPNPNSSGLFDGVTFKKEADDAQEVCNLSILLQLLSAMSLSTPLWLASCTCCNPHCWFSLSKQLEEKQNWKNILFFYHFSSYVC